MDRLTSIKQGCRGLKDRGLSRSHGVPAQPGGSQMGKLIWSPCSRWSFQCRVGRRAERSEGPARRGDEVDPVPAATCRSARGGEGKSRRGAGCPLRPRQSAAPEAAAAPAAAVAAGAPVVAPDAVAEKGAPDANKARLEISGKVQLDTIYDFKRINPAVERHIAAVADPGHLSGRSGLRQGRRDHLQHPADRDRASRASSRPRPASSRPT